MRHWEPLIVSDVYVDLKSGQDRVAHRVHPTSTYCGRALASLQP